MANDEKARAGLFRDIFVEQLKIVAVETQITTQPLDPASGFDHLAEVGNKAAALSHDCSAGNMHCGDVLPGRFLAPELIRDLSGRQAAQGNADAAGIAHRPTKHLNLSRLSPCDPRILLLQLLKHADVCHRVSDP